MSKYLLHLFFQFYPSFIFSSYALFNIFLDNFGQNMLYFIFIISYLSHSFIFNNKGKVKNIEIPPIINVLNNLKVVFRIK